MAFTRTDNVFGALDTSGTTLPAVAFNATSGRLIVGGFSHEGASAVLTASDTGADTFTNGTEEAHSGTDQFSQGFYDLLCNTQLANIVSAGTSASVPFRGIGVCVYSAAAAIEFDTQNTGEASGATSISVAVTTTGAVGVVYAKGKVYNSGRTLTGAGDATLIEQFGNFHAHFQKISSAVGTYTMTMNVAGGATDITMVVLAFKEASGGAVIIDLITASLKLTPQAIQNLFSLALTSATLLFTAQPLQTLTVVQLIISSLNNLAHDIQTRVELTLQSSSLNFLAQPISILASLSIDLIVASLNFTANLLDIVATGIYRLVTRLWVGLGFRH